MATKQRRLVGYRSEAASAAKLRIQAVEQALGRKLPFASKILRHEQRYTMLQLRFASVGRTQRAAATLLVIVESAATCALCMFVLLYLTRAHQYLLISAGFSVAATILAGLLSWKALKFLQADLHGYGDPLKMRVRRRALWLAVLTGGTYFILFGVVPGIYKGKLSLALAIPAALGALALCVGSWTLTGAWLARLQARSISRGIYLSVPAETVVHELLSSLLLVHGSGEGKLSLTKQRRLCGHLERAALALERGLRQQLDVADRATSVRIAVHVNGMAASLRDLKQWVATPRADTYPYLTARLLDAVGAAASGNWDSLPRSERPVVTRSSLLVGLSVAGVIVLAGAVSALATWGYNSLGLPPLPSAVAVSILGAGLLLLTYVVSLIDPDFASRVALAKQIRDAAGGK